MAILVLGSVTFQEMEIPPFVHIPGGHKIGKNVDIGGLRNAHAMGPDDGNIGWGGLLMGASAQDRSSQLQGMKDAGLEISFLCGDEFRMVMIETLDLVYRAPYEIAYKIECYVTSNPSRDASAGSASQSLNDIIGVDTGAITSLAGSVLASPGVTAIASAASAIDAVSDLDAASVVDLSALVPPVNAAVATLQAEVASAGATIAAGPNTVSMPQLAASLVGISAAYDAQLAKTQLANYGQRIVKNLVVAGAA